MRKSLFSILCFCLWVAPVFGQTLLEELQKLPSIPETTGLKVWLYGNQPGPDPTDPEQVEAARVCGGVLGYTALSDYVRAAAELAERSGSQLGLRDHPWYKYPHSPGYRGREYHDTLYHDRWVLEQAKIASGDTRVFVVQVDCETWSRNGGLDRRQHNESMADNHSKTFAMIREVFPNADVGSYGYSPKWGNNTLTHDKEVGSASLSMYYPLDRRRQESLFNQATQFAHSREKLNSVTVWVTLSAGYDAERNWEWDLKPPISTVTWLGTYLARGDHLYVHNIIIYDAFDQRAVSFEDYLVPFLKALLGG